MIPLPGTLWSRTGSLDMLGHEEMKLPTSSQRAVLFRSLLNLSRPWGVCRQNIKGKIKWWADNKHWVMWRGPRSTKRQAGELVSVPGLAKMARLLSFNRTQSRVVTGLLTVHNTLGRHLHVMGLSNNLTCRKCGTEEEISVHIFCECEALASLRHAHLDFLDPVDIMNVSIVAIWNCGNEAGLL